MRMLAEAVRTMLTERSRIVADVRVVFDCLLLEKLFFTEGLGTFT
jgi:hypothetical protein